MHIKLSLKKELSYKEIFCISCKFHHKICCWFFFNAAYYNLHHAQHTIILFAQQCSWKALEFFLCLYFCVIAVTSFATTRIVQLIWLHDCGESAEHTCHTFPNLQQLIMYPLKRQKSISLYLLLVQLGLAKWIRHPLLMLEVQG